MPATAADQLGSVVNKFSDLIAKNAGPQKLADKQMLENVRNRRDSELYFVNLGFADVNCLCGADAPPNVRDRSFPAILNALEIRNPVLPARNRLPIDSAGSEAQAASASTMEGKRSCHYATQPRKSQSAAALVDV